MSDQAQSKFRLSRKPAVSFQHKSIPISGDQALYQVFQNRHHARRPTVLESGAIFFLGRIAAEMQSILDASVTPISDGRLMVGKHFSDNTTGPARFDGIRVNVFGQRDQGFPQRPATTAGPGRGVEQKGEAEGVSAFA